MDAIYSLVKDDRSTFQKVLEQPLGRKLTYTILKSHNLEDNIILEDKVLAYDEDYIIQKSSLHHIFPQVTEKSDVKDDFVNIVVNAGLETLLQRYYTNKDGEVFIPVEILFDMLNEKGAEIPVTYTQKGTDEVDIQFTKKNPFSRDLPIDRLIRIAKDNKVLDEFILDERVAPYAQAAVLDNGVNPKINIKTWEYTAQRNKNDLLERYDRRRCIDG